MTRIRKVLTLQKCMNTAAQRLEALAVSTAQTSTAMQKVKTEGPTSAAPFRGLTTVLCTPFAFAEGKEGTEAAWCQSERSCRTGMASAILPDRREIFVSEEHISACWNLAGALEALGRATQAFKWPCCGGSGLCYARRARHVCTAWRCSHCLD